VRAFEAKIRHTVIKVERIKTHDVFVTAFVIAVTGFTLFGVNVFYSPVKAFFSVDVVLDVFMIMTVKTEFILAPFLERGVAVFTLLFKFSMVLGELSWHHQSLKIDC